MVKSESRGRDRSQGGARREAPRARPPCFGARGMERRRQSVENRLKPRELTGQGVGAGPRTRWTQVKLTHHHHGPRSTESSRQQGCPGLEPGGSVRSRVSHSSHLGSKSQEWEALGTARHLPPSLQAELPARQGEGCPPLLPWSKESKFSSPSPERSELNAMSLQHSRQANPSSPDLWQSGPGNPIPGLLCPFLTSMCHPASTG